MTVTTGGRGIRSSASSATPRRPSSTSDSATRLHRVAEFGRDQFGGVGVDHVVDVSIMPLFISTLMTSTPRRAMRLASSETVIVSGMITSRGPAGGGVLLLPVSAVQLAAVRGDRAHALFVARQRARDGELAGAPSAWRRLAGSRVLTGGRRCPSWR